MRSEQIGQRIKDRRDEIGLTLDDIATEIGVAKSTVMRYEKGTIEKIKLPVIEAIARVLNVNPSWLIGKSDDKFIAVDDQSEVEDSFTYAAHKYSGQLREEDKNTIIKMMQTLAAANEGSDNGRSD